MTLYLGPLGDTQRAVVRSNVPNNHRWRAHVAIGGAGAPTVTTIQDAQQGVIGVTRSGAGTYAITFPALAAIATSIPSITCTILQSAATTVTNAFPTAFSPTAGTATIVTYLNATGTAVDPANGDSFMIEIEGAHTLA